MKTPDEIKKGLEYCGDGNNCSYECPYREDCFFGYSRALEHDAMTYIQQLERELEAAKTLLYGECRACVKFEQQSSACCFCIHDHNAWNVVDDHWEWCGVKEEKTNED